MLFIICLIIAIISIILTVIFERNGYDFASLISAIIAFPTAAAAIIMLIVKTSKMVNIGQVQNKS